MLLTSRVLPRCVAGEEWSAEPGAWARLCADLEKLRSVLVPSSQSPHAEVQFVRPTDSETRDVRVSTVHLEEYGSDRLLVVCHDLTDFKARAPR